VINFLRDKKAKREMQMRLCSIITVFLLVFSVSAQAQINTDNDQKNTGVETNEKKAEDPNYGGKNDESKNTTETVNDDKTTEKDSGAAEDAPGNGTEDKRTWLVNPVDSAEKKVELSEKNGKRIIGFGLFYGGIFPVRAYDGIYNNAQCLGMSMPVFIASIWKIVPELNIRYISLASVFSRSRYNSTMKLLQMYPSLAYRHSVELPFGAGNRLVFTGRVFDGITRLEFKSWNSLNPAFGRVRFIEYINVFGAGAGLNFESMAGFIAGLDFLYSNTATAGRPLQGLCLFASIGWAF
jgi:hypothetical protein